MQENKQNEADWLGLERIVPGFGEEGGAGMDISSFHHSAVACSGLTGAVVDLGEARAGKGKGVVDEGVSGMCTLGGMEQWDISFGDLLALAEAASTTTAAGGLGHIGSSRGASSSHDFGPGSGFQFHGGCTTENNGLPVPPTLFAYDLNFPPGIMGNEVSGFDMPQFAPVTPCKIGMGENENVSEAQNLHAHEKENQGENENEVIASGFDSNRLEGPSQHDSSVLAVSEEGGTEMLELNKTPQQKPKRRKHRPKVIRENKPKQTQKPAATPKANGTVKRKYVRKVNQPATTPAEIGGDSADPEVLESRPAKNSCRRELKFDVQGQQTRQQDDSPTQPSFGLDSESRKENTRARIVIDLTCSEIFEGHAILPDTQMPNTASRTKTNTSLEIPEEQVRRPKRSCTRAAEEEASDTNMNGVQFNNLQFYASLLHFPNIYKKRRSEKGQNSTTCNAPSGWNSAPQLVAGGVPDKFESERDLQGKDQTILRLTKRRSKTVTRVRDLASLNKFTESQIQPHTSCIESLIADMSPALAKRKRSRTRNYVSGITSYKNKMSLHQQIVLYKHQQSTGKSSGGHRKVILWQDLVDAVTEQFEYLDINRESHREMNQERNALVPYNQDRNALVLYRRNGTIVPFQGPFSPIKKRHTRPKVELDDETTKVWRLLLENINNEGVDGTDEEKRKWWEEERRVFRGRADSFIARMHLVQGDRRFSRWKGSVVDSVIGVFLTQNVSDHLSSSAFMSLAARYPLKPERNHNPLEEEEEATLSVKEPEVCMLDSEQTIEWKKKIPNQQVCDQEEKEDVNSNISTIDLDSSQNSVNSSQNITTPYLEAELKNRIEPTFTELLKMAGSNMLHEVSSHRNEDFSFGENCKDICSTSEQSILTVESGSQGTTGQEIVTVQESSTSCSENNQSQVQETLDSQNLSVKTLDVTESTVRASDDQINTKKKAAVDKALKEINAAKQKSRRVGREIRNGVDWDALRSGAEANGKKREKTPSTMDSLDWESVRCADVNDIAETIKERGMNHMLAERIKAFLNRLVKDHGSIDLEWLRDVSPDEAKEYLLSIRGLGLKSVECVRLLTLHHLAFPVDTNVGRIAVRLGWVPLQPLPESLQLHLLELYPVLESIQKYLWPRLCKLEQTQLYELHYQMITFGKVFCTKSKPNCNACPMRGECRHFASAFASARLALPAPEEKSIVPATNQKTATPDNDVRVNGLPLPPPQAIQQLEGSTQLEAGLIIDRKSVAGSCEPIIEEPASPEPENTQELEHDIEDALYGEDPDEIPTIKLNIEEFTQNLQNYMEKNMELQAGEMSKALVALTPEAASLPTAKLKNVSRLRTEHQVYELPDSHPLLEGMDKREPDDPCSYLLAIWTPGETATSIQPPEGGCQYQEFGKLCDQKTCFTCNSIKEANSQVVRGTLLIPCRTAMRGSFPLNGTYFQVNEVFADHNSSLNPIDVPRSWLWNLPRRTVYFGTSVPSIFKGLPTEGIQHCFWRGYVCVRGFDQKTRAPRPLMARLHFPASKLPRSKGKTGDE